MPSHQSAEGITDLLEERISALECRLGQAPGGDVPAQPPPSLEAALAQLLAQDAVLTTFVAHLAFHLGWTLPEGRELIRQIADETVEALKQGAQAAPKSEREQARYAVAAARDFAERITLSLAETEAEN